ncbi:RNA polymerase sigma factor [Pedobacter frigoris]|uniref:RNA polymerase sigma-70 factor n=1 Tax=Pedobacter frigoris TaxID=2571272 RepID=A0A4U1CQH9_9SPHI|nr:RNA polymerase sigma-70 factor [Pedobacter frigoris]TKC09150.1 RNA polymerase sigma-70 factor [Pedobacter frigoris]
MEKETEKNDQYWIDALSGADETALSHFFKQYAKSLGYFTNRLVHDKQEAEDIVATCFIKLWQRRSSFKTVDNIKAFLYLSCKNACLDYLRHVKVKTLAQERYLNQDPEAEETILYHIVKAEVLQVLNQEIEQLPNNYRQVFKLIYFENKKTDEIALELGLTPQTVRNYKTRTIELLKTAMIKRGVSSAGILALLLYLDK